MSQHSHQDTPPKPQLVIRVGVTGHRVPPKLPTAAHPQVEATVQRVLRAIMGAAKRVSADHPLAFGDGDHAIGSPSPRPPATPRGVIVSSLAKGADQIVARAGLASGFALDAVLPFAPGVNEADFPDAGEAEDFAGLLAQARSKFFLDGTRDEGIAAGRQTKRGYEAAGLIMLANADILVAVWDGEEAAGMGGTAQIVARAAAEGIPIVHIHPERPGEATLLWTGFSKLPPQSVRIEHLDPHPEGHIGDIVEALFAPPTAPAGHADPDGLWTKVSRFAKSLRTPGEHAHHAGGDRDVALAQYLGEHERLRFDWLERRYPRLLAWYGARPFRPEDKAIPPYAQSTSTAWSPFMASCPPDGACTPVVSGALAKAFAFADHLGVYYSLRYRGAFVAGYFLAFVAVLLALLSVIPLLFNDAGVKAGLVGAELFIIGLILWIIVQGSAGGWHERWLAYRRVAELLRPMRILALVGAMGPVGRPRGRDPDEGFALWYARAMRRMIPVPDAVVDREYLDAVRRAAADCTTDGRPVSEIEDQIAYHENTIKRLSRMDEKLHFWGDVSFKLTFYIGVTYVAVFIYYAFVGEPWYKELKDSAYVGYWIKALTTFFMAGLPALGATLSAVRAQAEFAALKTQSERTLAALRLVKEAIAAEPDASLALLSDRIERAVDVMQTDLSAWLALSRARPLALPA